MKCIHCGHTLPDGMYKCVNPKCRMWNTGSTMSMEDSTVLLSDAKAGAVERVNTGLIDFCAGGGVVRTSVTLLAGDPGAGKTTICLQLANVFAGIFKREALYIANEQDPSELRETGMRLKLENLNRIRVVKAMGGVQHNIGSLLLHYAPCLTILDSVTKWSGEDMNEAVIICQRLKDYTVKLNAPTIVINQVTKSGEHAGLNKMQHAVDATMMLEVWGEQPEDPRRLHVRKNRNGPAPASQYYEMTGLGLVEIDELEALTRLKKSGQERPIERKDESDDDNDEEDEDEQEDNNSME